ncbi:MAG: hypothetical protein NXH78_00895 [Hyphomonadaceae bacterium]|nr:hypothetical protein [Hyphomonadaceae bacterium]
MRLPSRERTQFDLQEFVTAWSMLTVPIYTFVVGVFVFLILPVFETGFADINLAEQFAALAMYSVVVLPFAGLTGALPALGGGAFAYFTTRTIMFERVSRPAATPSQILAASSGQ